MAHNLRANNKELAPFHMASDWLHLLAQCGAYFTCIHSGAKWYMLYDERMTTHNHPEDEGEERKKVTEEYPAIICNCGFEITEEEAQVMSRIARNYATIQQSISDEFIEEQGGHPFPKKIREDWVRTYEAFAVWAEQSQGFKVY